MQANLVIFSIFIPRNVPRKEDGNPIWPHPVPSGPTSLLFSPIQSHFNPAQSYAGAIRCMSHLGCLVLLRLLAVSPAVRCGDVTLRSLHR